jgi:hypothetical protein
MIFFGEEMLRRVLIKYVSYFMARGIIRELDNRLMDPGDIQCREGLGVCSIGKLPEWIPKSSRVLSSSEQAPATKLKKGIAKCVGRC